MANVIGGYAGGGYFSAGGDEQVGCAWLTHTKGIV
jgi:hypothetical protein